MRTTTLTAAGLLGLALLSPTTAAAAAGETCRGEAATIVGTGPTITGTEGRDVVVTNGATNVTTLGGDDVICVSAGGASPLKQVAIDSGAGDDVVDGTTAPGWLVNAELGEGADRFEGAGGVVSGGMSSYPYADSAKDVILGASNVTSGELGQLNHDVIVLTDKNDLLNYRGIMASDGSIDGGAGEDSLLPTIRSESGDTVIDNAAGRLLLDGQVVATWSGFETFWTGTRDGHELRFVGTSADETVYANVSGKVHATFGAGDDDFNANQAPRAGSVLDGGDGRDLFYVTTESGLLDLDMEKGRLRAEPGSPYSSSVTDFEDASLFARRVVLAGTDSGNRLAFSACDAHLRGRRGPDTFVRSYDALFETVFCPRYPKAHMNGGRGRDDLRGTIGKDVLQGGKGADLLDGDKGDDRLAGGKGRDDLRGGAGNDTVRGGRGHDDLRGQSGNDRLYGGKGRDRADGGPGNDLCRAERERRCER